MELSELKDDIIIITTNSSSEDVPLMGEEVANLRRELSTTQQTVLYNKFYFAILENNKRYEEHNTTSRYER